MNTKAANHIGIPVSDLDQSLRFYRDVFGVEPEFVTEYGDRSLSERLRVEDPRIRIAFLKLAAGVAIELLEFRSPRSRAYSLRDSDVGATHVCLEVEDIDSAFAELQAKGVDCYADPFLEPGPGPFAGTRWLFFKDPDGISFELLERHRKT